VDLTALDDEGRWEVLREGALDRDELTRRLREVLGDLTTP
jgi:hypothetical protein